jgi:hypothetical protein
MSPSSHSNELISGVPNQSKSELKLSSEIPVVQVPIIDLTPLVGKLMSQEGSILLFLIVLCALTQMLTSLVKAIKS